MLEIKNAWSLTSADRSHDSSTGMSCYQFGIQPLSSHWTQNDHCTERMATTKAEICCSPTAHSLRSHLQETQDKSLQAVFKQKIF